MSAPEWLVVRIMQAEYRARQIAKTKGWPVILLEHVPELIRRGCLLAPDVLAHVLAFRLGKLDPKTGRRVAHDPALRRRLGRALAGLAGPMLPSLRRGERAARYAMADARSGAVNLFRPALETTREWIKARRALGKTWEEIAAEAEKHAVEKGRAALRAGLKARGKSASEIQKAMAENSEALAASYRLGRPSPEDLKAMVESGLPDRDSIARALDLPTGDSYRAGRTKARTAAKRDEERFAGMKLTVEVGQARHPHGGKRSRDVARKDSVTAAEPTSTLPGKKGRKPDEKQRGHDDDAASLAHGKDGRGNRPATANAPGDAKPRRRPAFLPHREQGSIRPRGRAFVDRKQEAHEHVRPRPRPGRLRKRKRP